LPGRLCQPGGGQIIQAGHHLRTQPRAKRRLERGAPVGRGVQIVEQGLNLDALRAQPGLGPAAAGQRRLLQGFERGQAPALLADGGLQTGELGSGRVQLRPTAADVGLHRRQRLLGSGRLGAGPGQLLGKPGLVRRGFGRQLLLFAQQALAPLFQAGKVLGQPPGAFLLQALVLGSLAHRRAGRIVGEARLTQGDFGGGEGLRGLRQLRFQALPIGIGRLLGRGQLHQARLGLHALLIDLLCTGAEARQLLRQALALLLQGRERLLAAGDLRADLIPGLLGFAQGGRGLRVRVARRLDLRLARPHGGKRLFLRRYTAFECRSPLAGGGLQDPQPKPQQLPARLALGGLQFAKALRRARLALQGRQTLAQLVPQVVQARHVVAGMPNAAGRLVAALLVLGDAGHLLDVGAQLLGPRLDQAGDHALLDDGVAARAKPGAQEDVGDVAAPATAAVEEIDRLPVACQLAPHGDLRIGCPGAAQRAAGIVEHQLDTGLADRLAGAGTVEDHVCQRIAAQLPGRAFAQHPAHGVDHIRLAAAVRAHHAGQRPAQVQRGRINEGLEARQANGLQFHA
jgi:hypothetical protein